MKSSIKLFQSKWALNNHDEDCRLRNMLCKDKDKWECKCNEESESESETESEYKARKEQEELEDFAQNITSQLKDEWYRDSESDNESVLSEIDYEEQEIEAIKKEQLIEKEERKKEQADRKKWNGEADTEPQNHKTTTISKKIPEMKKISKEPIKHMKKEEKQITHNLSIIPKTFQDKFYAVFGDKDLRVKIMSNDNYYYYRLEREVIRKAMYLQDGMLFLKKVHMFNIHLVCSNIYDYHYHITERNVYIKYGEKCGKSIWERNCKRVYQSVIHNTLQYIPQLALDYYNIDYNDDTKMNKDDPNSNKKRYNNGDIKLPFLDLLFNGNKYGSCLMRKKRREDCPLYLILKGFFDWLYSIRVIDDVVEDEVVGFSNKKEWWELY